MLYGIGLSGTGGQIERARLENVSNNLANVETVGFKQDLLTAMQRPPESRTVLEPWEAERMLYQHDLLDKLGGGVELRKSHTVHQPGPMEKTDNQFDMALGGQGFFMVEAAGSGQRFYTRAGNFKQNSDGMLVTTDGQHFVLDERGGRIDIGGILRDNGATQFSINDEGAISVSLGDAGTAQTGQRIGVAIFDEAGLVQLEKAGETLFLAPEEAAANAKMLTDLPTDERAGTTRLLQGFVEGSGANPVALMVELIDVSRAFERNMSLLRMQSGTVEQLISRVGSI